MATKEQMMALLLAQRAAKARLKDSFKAGGRLGEILVEAWLREASNLEVLALPQEQGTRRQLILGDGKRPDFMVTPLKPDGTDDGDTLLIDAKFHRLDDGVFYLPEKELAQYEATMAEWAIPHCFFAVIPNRRPNRLILIGIGELVDEPGMARRTFRLDDTADREALISREAYERARQQLVREAYDISLVPDYPETSA